MEKNSNDYHISFFKPTTDRARSNRNMVIWLVSVWFLAVFGFHIVLRIIEKPVPEPVYEAFETSWTNIEGGNYGSSDLQEFGKSCLSVTGKINITTEEKSILDNAVTWAIYELTPEEERSSLLNKIVEFENISETISSISDENYIAAKSQLTTTLGNTLAISDYDVRKKLIPFALQSSSAGNLNELSVSELPALMSKYLIHNRSVLTDMRFLGFPFHYFYTAVFLLILFVALCWIYCVRTDAMNKKLAIAE